MEHKRLNLIRTPLSVFVPLSVGVLLVCLYYTYVAVVRAPYPGILLTPTWIVDAIPPCLARSEWCQADANKLQTGDQLTRIGGLHFEDTRVDRRRGAFEGYQPGDVVPIELRRDGRPLAVDWVMLGPIQAESLERLSSLLIFLPFWIAGTAVMLSLRPRDGRWRLFILFNYSTALWLAVGLFSSLHAAGASLVVHALSWLLAPLYLHLHLMVPSPLLARRQWYLMVPLYLIATILAGLELIQVLPESLYGLGLVTAILGSLVLLAYRLLRPRPAAERLAARLIFVGIAVSLMPGIVLGVLPRLLHVSLYQTVAPDLAILAVPFLPYFYIYAIYKHHLGSLEFRANRLLSLCSFIRRYKKQGNVFSGAARACGDGYVNCANQWRLP